VGVIVKKRCYFILTTLLVLISACAAIQISSFDRGTYEHLTFLKAQMSELYSNYTQIGIQISKIRKMQILLEQYAEYEKWKPHNTETYKQFQLIEDMFNRHLRERLDSKNPWSKSYTEHKLSMINNLINISIKTELHKNRGC